MRKASKDGAWGAVAMLLMGWLLIVSVVNTMDSCLPTPPNSKRFGEDSGSHKRVTSDQ